MDLRGRRFLSAVLIFGIAKTAGAQSAGTAKLKTGKEIFEAGCAGCHGADGKGAPQDTIGFELPRTFPDFTQCSQTTPEDNWVWKSIIRDGGPSRGFSQIMPSFGAALSTEQIDAVVKYLRSLCTEQGWPRGELNLPLALATEKAFPENEAVIRNAMNVTGAPGYSGEIVHEQRFGAKTQIEIALPVEVQRPMPGLWYGGAGDLVLGVKRVLFSSLQSHSGSILSLQGEAILPTGHRGHGLGSGTTTFGMFAAYGQLLPHKTFFQIQGGADLPTNTAKSAQGVFLHTAVGKMFNENSGLGRMWSPMVEFLGDRVLQDGAKTNWDVMPELQVTLSKRQHVRFNAGLRIPATNTSGRQTQVMFYVLWDWFDGRLLEGWK